MLENLTTLGVATKRFLSEHLPELGADWWERGVLPVLSFPQRQLARERGWTSLDDLDVASLLRVVDGNWDRWRASNLVSYEARNWLKESAAIRNRVAHEAPGAPRDPRRDYRDLDTLARLASVMGPGSDEARSLETARDGALVPLAPSAPIPAAGAMQGFVPGAQVRLGARPETVGLVAEVRDGGIERQVTVFHDNVLHTYFESQLELASIGGGAIRSPDELRAGLAAELLLRPSTSRLYSFNSGRIDYEPYQFRPVMKLISSDRPRLLIADDVGVGKTIEAGLIIKELQARQRLDSVLIICPKQLITEGKWRSELKRFDEDFVELDSKMLRYCIDEARLEGEWPSRYRKAILPYSLLDERLLLGQSDGRSRRHGLLSLLPPVKFDLVIADEAHHLRNRDTWQHRVVDHLLSSAEAAVLISATPIQTGSNDLYTLLRLLRPDLLTGPAEFERMREPNASLSRAEVIARAGGDAWPSEALSELDNALSTAWGSAVMAADPRAAALEELLRSEPFDDKHRVRVVRLLQSLNTFSGLINRTRRRDIGAFTVRKPETVEVAFTADQQQVHDSLLGLCARILAARGHAVSVEFLLSTLRRQASSSLNGLAPFIQDLLEGRLTGEELSEADVEDDSLDPGDLGDFRAEIRELGERAGQLDDDPKLDALLTIAEDKRQMDNNKLLVFSTFRHTLAYVLPALEARGSRVGLVHGGIPDRDRREIRARFALDPSDPDALDVLLSSEVGTEGLDNQFCDAMVNYDIPWNPMRIEQRIGRIDRRGQLSESVSIKNLIVAGTVDAAIYERCLLRIGIFRESLGAGEEVLGELTREMRAIGDDLSLTPAERDSRLQQLADNKLARIQEQIELEEREGSLFGLAVQKVDDEGIERLASPWLSSEQLERLVTRYLTARGHERADGLFSRPVALLRPDRTTRVALRADASPLRSAASGFGGWFRWLETDGDASRRLTFDPKLAEETIELLSPTHPLVIAAARAEGAAEPGSTVAVTAPADELAPGRYPFAVFGWQTLGVRDDFRVQVLTTDREQEHAVERALLAADPGDATLTSAELDLLDAQHYDRWATARAEHIEHTNAHVEAQLASLQLSRNSRLAQLEDQLAAASHPNILRMREGELRAVEYDFDQRSEQLRRAVERSDITTTMLYRGVLEVL